MYRVAGVVAVVVLVSSCGGSDEVASPGSAPEELSTQEQAVTGPYKLRCGDTSYAYNDLVVEEVRGKIRWTAKGYSVNVQKLVSTSIPIFAHRSIQFEFSKADCRFPPTSANDGLVTCAGSVVPVTVTIEYKDPNNPAISRTFRHPNAALVAHTRRTAKLERSSIPVVEGMEWQLAGQLRPTGTYDDFLAVNDLSGGCALNGKTLFGYAPWW